MERNDMYKLLVRCKRPHEFFGPVADETELKHEYFRYIKLLHPDVAPANEKYIAEEAVKRLNELYSLGKSEMADGIFGIVSAAALYQGVEPLFSLTLHRQKYDFYEYAFDGEASDLYKGLNGGNVVYLKHIKDEADNGLLEGEYDTLARLAHVQLPVVRERLSVNGRSAMIMDEIEGVMLSEIMEQYPKGIPGEHIVWILERLLSVVGYLHFNKIVHGNLTPENVMLNKANHKVSLVGFTFHIPCANEPGAEYKTRPAQYAAPEIRKGTPVSPAADIYSIGKLAVQLFGGDISSNGMPVAVDARIRAFIRRLVERDVHLRPYDAWKLGAEIVALRQEVYGNRRFITFE